MKSFGEMLRELAAQIGVLFNPLVPLGAPSAPKPAPPEDADDALKMGK